VKKNEKDENNEDEKEVFRLAASRESGCLLEA